jgi:uncharacterized protein YjbI with pentapeptide repeats
VTRTRPLAMIVGLLLVVGASACNNTEHTMVGACRIRPGSACAGNFMEGARLPDSQLYDVDLSHADLTRVDLARSDMSGAILASPGPTSRTRISATRI